MFARAESAAEITVDAMDQPGTSVLSTAANRATSRSPAAYHLFLGPVPTPGDTDMGSSGMLSTVRSSSIRRIAPVAAIVLAVLVAVGVTMAATSSDTGVTTGYGGPLGVQPSRPRTHSRLGHVGGASSRAPVEFLRWIFGWIWRGRRCWLEYGIR